MGKQGAWEPWSLRTGGRKPSPGWAGSWAWAGFVFSGTSWHFRHQGRRTTVKYEESAVCLDQLSPSIPISGLREQGAWEPWAGLGSGWGEGPGCIAWAGTVGSQSPGGRWGEILTPAGRWVACGSWGCRAGSKWESGCRAGLARGSWGQGGHGPPWAHVHFIWESLGPWSHRPFRIN